MKKLIIAITIILLAGLVLIGGGCFDKEKPVEPTIEKYAWEENLGEEDVSKRTAYTRDYAHPTDPNKRVLIQAFDIINPEQVLFGDTDTSSTNNKDTYLKEYSPDTNYGSGSDMGIIGDDEARRINAIIHFTLSSGSGTISDVKLKLYESTQTQSSDTADVHELTQTGWVEDEATWNEYSSGNSWTSAGGDYNATIIDSTTIGDGNGWKTWVLMGTGATNPLTLDWSDNIHLLLKTRNRLSPNCGAYVNSKEAASNKPYLEITYEAPADRRIIITQ